MQFPRATRHLPSPEGIKSKITTIAAADHDHGGADHGSNDRGGRTIAEGVGFEPTRTLPRPSGFQDHRTRPLCEPSRTLNLPYFLA